MRKKKTNTKSEKVPRHDLSTKKRATAKKKEVTKKKVVKKPKVEKPFADGTLSSSAFFGMIRSCLRRKSMYWPSIQKARKAAQIPYIGENKRLKYLYVCADCSEAFPSSQCQIHHLEECGSLSSFEDIGEFVRKLFCNSDKLICICKSCHDKRHKDGHK